MKPQRCFLLQRFHDLTEVPILKTHLDCNIVFTHYVGLLNGRVDRSLAATNVSFEPTDIGPLIATYSEEFPESELPFNGGIETFSMDGYDYRFDAFGANAVRTLMDAEMLHSQALCKPLMCSNHACFNYCGALDEFTFVPPLAFFARLCSDRPQDTFMSVCDIIEGDEVFDASEVTEITEATPAMTAIARATPILLDEYVLEFDPAPTGFVNGDVIIHGCRWELYPVPSDASRLDMHLAQISSLDTKYAQRFTREVRYMDEAKEPPQKPPLPPHPQRDAADELEPEAQDPLFESDSDTESYVESALIPGLRHRDFSKPMDTVTALSGLSLDESTQLRMREILSS